MGNIRYCRQCGHALSDESRFCEYCGAKVERSESKGNAPCDHSHGTTELPPVTLGEAVRLFFTRYVDFEGRSRRSEFWGAQLALWVCSGLVNLVLRDSMLTSFWSLATFLPGLALSIRRLHDIGKSWVYYLWNLLPVAGQVILLYYYQDLTAQEIAAIFHQATGSIYHKLSVAQQMLKKTLGGV